MNHFFSAEPETYRILVSIFWCLRSPRWLRRSCSIWDLRCKSNDSDKLILAWVVPILPKLPIISAIFLASWNNNSIFILHAFEWLLIIVYLASYSNSRSYSCGSRNYKGLAPWPPPGLLVNGVGALQRGPFHVQEIGTFLHPLFIDMSLRPFHLR